MKIYIPVLAEHTTDRFKIYVNDRGTMLCGDQLDERYLKLHDVLEAIEKCEGDLDYLKSMLPKDPS